MVEWQTRTLEGRMERSVQVQVLSGAYTSSGNAAFLYFLLIHNTQNPFSCVAAIPYVKVVIFCLSLPGFWQMRVGF